MIQHKFKKILNYSFTAKIAAFILDDLLKGMRLLSGNISTNSGAIHSKFSLKESINYIEEVFKDYKQYGSIDTFYGKVAEVGPGDNTGIALLMRKDGCEEVDLIDRFLSYRETERQKKIYKALAQKHSLENLKKTKQWDENQLNGITWKVGQAAETYFRDCYQQEEKLYDFIVSRAVLEHLYNPLLAIELMVNCLKPGGIILHKIDFRDHGMFTPHNHELKFLEIPGYIYPWMVSNSGRPNRILVHKYRDCLEKLKSRNMIDYKILVTHLVNEEKEVIPHVEYKKIDQQRRKNAIEFVESKRQYFAPKFKNIDSQDLSISGIFLKVTKKI